MSTTQNIAKNKRQMEDTESEQNKRRKQSANTTQQATMQPSDHEELVGLIQQLCLLPNSGKPNHKTIKRQLAEYYQQKGTPTRITNDETKKAVEAALANSSTDPSQLRAALNPVQGFTIPTPPDLTDDEDEEVDKAIASLKKTQDKLVEVQAAIAALEASETNMATNNGAGSSNTQLLSTAQVAAMLPVFQNTGNISIPETPDQPDLDLSEDEDEEVDLPEGVFIIEKILERELGIRSKIGEHRYLIKWEGYGVKEATWEPRSALPTALVDEFDKVWEERLKEHAEADAATKAFEDADDATEPDTDDEAEPLAEPTAEPTAEPVSEAAKKKAKPRQKPVIDTSSWMDVLKREETDTRHVLIRFNCEKVNVLASDIEKTIEKAFEETDHRLGKLCKIVSMKLRPIIPSEERPETFWWDAGMDVVVAMELPRESSSDKHVEFAYHLCGGLNKRIKYMVPEGAEKMIPTDHPAHQQYTDRGYWNAKCVMEGGVFTQKKPTEYRAETKYCFISNKSEYTRCADVKQVFQKYLAQYQETEEMLAVQDEAVKALDARQEIDQSREASGFIPLDAESEEV